jgi:hypothetical protein
MPVELMDELEGSAVELSQPVKEFAQCGHGIGGM